MWAVGTRAFNIVSQLISRIMTFSTPALSEMIVRGEHLKLRERFKDIVMLSASVGGFSAIVFSVCNSTFVQILSHGTFTWATHDSVLLGVWLVLLSVLGCHNNLVLAVKRVGMMRYIYFIEGSVFVGSAWITSRWGGLSAIIASSILCTAIFTFSYGIRRTSQYFDIPAGEILIRWQLPMFRVCLFFSPIALLTWLATQSLGDFVRLGILCAVSSTIGAAILISQGLPGSLKNELLSRAPRPVSGLFQRLFNYR